ncbi:MAG TPA: hypothetical protein VK249_34620, partial [Anaerolineales bacterium]|nr:hypothetical protein [Anaerolineales bacterium]
MTNDHENAASEWRNRMGLLENDLARNLIKIPTLFRKRTSALSIREIPRLALKTIRVLRTDGMRGLKQRIGNKIDLGYEYVDWVNRYDTLTFADRAAIRRHIEHLVYQPLISLIMPTYNTPEKWLWLAIDSVKKQLYP